MNRCASIMLSLLFMGSMIASEIIPGQDQPFLPDDIVKLTISYLCEPSPVLRTVSKLFRDCIKIHVHSPIILQAKCSQSKKKTVSERKLLRELIENGSLYMHDYLVFDGFFSREIFVSVLKQGDVKLRFIGREAVDHFLGQVGPQRRYHLDCWSDTYECIARRDQTNLERWCCNIEPGKGFICY